MFDMKGNNFFKIISHISYASQYDNTFFFRLPYFHVWISALFST